MKKHLLLLTAALLALAAPAHAETACKPGKQAFAQVFEGMPYEIVMGVLGCFGELKTRSLTRGQETLVYEWSGSGQPNAKISAVFINNMMVMKSAYGLE